MHNFSGTSDNLYWIWLSLRLGVANSSYLAILDKFGSPFEIYSMSESDYPTLEGISDAITTRLSNKSLDESYKILDFCVSNNIGVLSYNSKNYPPQLRTLRNPPMVLYYKGTLPNFSASPTLAIVGTRKMSDYGKNSAYKTSYELAAAGTVIVSGMALGIDGVVACGAIEAEGQTIAVLGCGIDVIYPSQHAKLMEAIIRNGAVITEFAPGTRPAGENFPIRNRIISGLSRATLVIEADMKSGALITAKNAIVQGREVYALPGNIGESNSDGTNALIRDGAGIVLSAEDILKTFEFLFSNTINYTRLRYMQQKYIEPDNILPRYSVSSRTTKTTQNKYSNSPLVEINKLSLQKVKAKNTKNTESATILVKEKVQETLSKNDNSAEIISALKEKYRKIFEELPLDRAVSIEKLTALGYPISDIIGAMTVLEIKGLVSSLPGGLFVRK